MKTQEMLRIAGWVMIGLCLLAGSGIAFVATMGGQGSGIDFVSGLIAAAVVIAGLAFGAPFLGLADLLDKMDRQHDAIVSLHRTLALQASYTGAQEPNQTV
jgi:uncharacterized membrane protein